MKDCAIVDHVLNHYMMMTPWKLNWFSSLTHHGDNPIIRWLAGGNYGVMDLIHHCLLTVKQCGICAYKAKKKRRFMHYSLFFLHSLSINIRQVSWVLDHILPPKLFCFNSAHNGKPFLYFECIMVSVAYGKTYWFQSDWM